MSKSRNDHEPHACTCSGTEYLTVNDEFWCERHQCWKTQHYHELCQTRPGYRQMWEEGRGPGQQSKPRAKSGKPRTSRTPKGPGDILRKMLGCSAKRWPYYEAMNHLGARTEHHVEEFARHLASCHYAACDSPESAKRLIELALEKWQSRSGGNNCAGSRGCIRTGG